jgi:hypothetical protein
MLLAEWVRCACVPGPYGLSFVLWQVNAVQQTLLLADALLPPTGVLWFVVHAPVLSLCRPPYTFRVVSLVLPNALLLTGFFFRAVCLVCALQEAAPVLAPQLVQAQQHLPGGITNALC